MNTSYSTLKIFKLENCGSCTSFTIKYYCGIKNMLLKNNIIDQIENIILTKNNLEYYKNFYNIDNQCGAPLLIIEKVVNKKISFNKFKGKYSEILQILNWINEFLINN